MTRGPRTIFFTISIACLVTALAICQSARAEAPPASERAKWLAERVTIYRDSFGVAHIDAESIEPAVFGFAFAQAEDYFWQLEDNYLLSLGRYAEAHGQRGLNSDLLNRAFQIVPRAQSAFAKLDPGMQAICSAFTEGVNFYLATHPETKPRLLTRFEPWYVLAYGRHMVLELCYRRTGLSDTYLPRSHDLIWSASGSNGWAIAPSKTASGNAMLVANPHLPWFGFAQLFEAHVRSADGWNFAGATTYGNPVMTMGHNDDLGWTLTTNEPDIADLWLLTFDDPKKPLNYRFDHEYLTATQRKETIAVQTATGVTQREFTLRDTHYGPIVSQEDKETFLAARISGLDDALMLKQSLRMMRSKTLEEFRRALAMAQFPLMNIVYADRRGNIFFLYNALAPKRDESFDWTRPVDGTDPKAKWRGMLSIDELPKVLNPTDGYLQNCNSSPFTTCDSDNPVRSKFPKYLTEDGDDDKRRAQRSREILREMKDVTFEQVQAAAFDTEVYWARQELPKYAEYFQQLKEDNPKLAAEIEPYLDHLLNWDCRITLESTAATLCEAWYTELHGASYPGETLKRRYSRDRERQLRALVKAANILVEIHGKWRVPWGEVFRLQRHARVSDLIEIPFDDRTASLSCLGGPGPMGVVFTEYYLPSMKIPFVKTLKNRYGIIGTSYLAVYEFGEKFRGATSVCFGASGDPNSPHFQDQAQLVAQQKLKPELFDWKEIAEKAVAKYRPIERLEKP